MPATSTTKKKLPEPESAVPVLRLTAALREQLVRYQADTPMYRMVLDIGRGFTASAPMPEGQRLGRPKLCYWNAYELALGEPSLTYVEGYAATARVGGVPIFHAWCCDRDGRVIDPTWRFVRNAEAGYFGIPIKADFVKGHKMDAPGDTILWRLVGKLPPELFVERLAADAAWQPPVAEARA